MANVKISDLTAAAAAAGTNEFEINEAGTSKKVTGSQILAYVKANTTAADIGAQASDAQLTDIAGLTPTDNGVIIGNGTNFVVESGATLKTSLGLTIGTDVQAYDALLTSLAGQTVAANKIQAYSAADTASLLDFKDEDNMVSDSATAVPSQQSVKAYVDTSIAALGGGAWELVTSTSVTAVANIDFDLQEDIYCEWKFVIDGVIPATDDVYLLMRPGYSSGTVFDSANGFAGYQMGSLRAGAWKTATNGYTVIGAIGSGAGFGEGGVGTAAGEHAHAVITIGGLGSTLASGFVYESKCGFVDAGGNARQDVIIGGYTPGNAERLWDSVRFLWSTGNFEATGTIKMFGLRRAG